MASYGSYVNDNVGNTTRAQRRAKLWDCLGQRRRKPSSLQARIAASGTFTVADSASDSNTSSSPYAHIDRDERKSYGEIVNRSLGQLTRKQRCDLILQQSYVPSATSSYHTAAEPQPLCDSVTIARPLLPSRFTGMPAGRRDWDAHMHGGVSQVAAGGKGGGIMDSAPLVPASDSYGTFLRENPTAPRKRRWAAIKQFLADKWPSRSKRSKRSGRYAAGEEGEDEEGVRAAAASATTTTTTTTTAKEAGWSDERSRAVTDTFSPSSSYQSSPASSCARARAGDGGVGGPKLKLPLSEMVTPDDPSKALKEDEYAPVSALRL